MYDVIAENYSEIFPLDSNRVEFIRTICKDKLKRILDVGCATGDLSIALDQYGYEITGIDINKKMISIAIAKKEDNSDNSKIEFYTKNMLNINELSVFDCILCLGNTLPHLNSLNQVQLFFNMVFEKLSKNSCFIFQILNYDKIMSQKSINFNLIETDSFQFKREYYFNDDDTVKFIIRFTDHKNKEIYSDFNILLPLYQEQLKLMLDIAGFSNLKIYSNYDRAKSDLNEYFTVYHAIKIEQNYCAKTPALI